MYVNDSHQKIVKKQIKEIDNLALFVYLSTPYIALFPEEENYTTGKLFTLVAPNINSEDKCYCLEGKSNGAKNINYDHCCQGLLEPCRQLC